MDGGLRLWSCRTAAGPAGTAFVADLAQASGAGIAAATGLVGAAARGGGWELTAAARPPLTAAGVAAYEGAMALKTWNGTTGSWFTAANWGGTLPVAGDTVSLPGSGNYVVTIDTADTPSIAALTLTSQNSTHTTTLTLANNHTLNVSGTTTFSDSNSTINGAGTISAGGAITGSGTIQAGTASSGGTLDVFGTINSGVVLKIGTFAASDLKIEGTATSAAPITINNSNQTLEIGSAGNLTITGGTESITNGKIQIDGGILSTSGLTIGNAATLIGSGTVNNAISGAGTITAKNGTLNLNGTISSGPTFTIDTSAPATLEFSGTAMPRMQSPSTTAIRRSRSAVAAI